MPDYRAIVAQTIEQLRVLSEHLDACLRGLVAQRGEAYDRGRAEEREEITAWLAETEHRELAAHVRRGAHRPGDAADKLEIALRRWDLK